jgi:hypothetical protein
MLANASIRNTTMLQGLAHCAFRRLASLRERFVVPPRLDPRFRGDDKCWLGRSVAERGRGKILVNDPIVP